MRNYVEELAEARKALVDYAQKYEEKALACAEAHSAYLQAKNNAGHAYSWYVAQRNTVRSLAQLVDDPLGTGDRDPVLEAE